MEKSLEEVLCAVYSSDYNIFDDTLAFNEDYEPVSYSPDVEAVDIDAFDCVSIPAFESTGYIKSIDRKQQDWAKFAREIETGETVFWDSYDEFTLADLENVRLSFASAVSEIQTEDNQTLEETLAEFDNWAGTPVDILSCYGDYEYGHNVFEGDFDMNVPVRIYTCDDEVVVKANFPWIKSNSTEEIYPDELNLKSVLSILPVRVNSQEVKASFVNGEFKLEFPKEQNSKLYEEKSYK